MSFQLIEADCIEAMAAMEEASVDAIVTDPPYNLSFMGRSWDSFKGSDIDPGFLHWFAGFTDGEGCFGVHKKNVNGYETYDCQFSITLRADDRPILERIHRTLGIGTLSKPTAHRTGPDNPKARYSVSAKADLCLLRDIFRGFPLRAKKAKDFELWSDALDAWLKHEPGDWADMAAARTALMASRDYVEEGVRVDPFQMWCWRWGREALRVLKPGGHVLCFGGTRTQHRLVAGLEDAGFEIRDCLAWLYGSGFPKSLDVSKAIDKKRDDSEAKWAVADWLRPHVERIGFDVVTQAFGFGDETMARARWTSHSQTNTPTWNQWLKLKELCGFDGEMDAEVWRLNGRKGTPGEAWAQREVIGVKSYAGPAGNAANFGVGDLSMSDTKRDLTAPATPEAQTWQGWGTALKPAFEPIVLARKPLIGSVAQNVLEHGTGALNIDGTRIGTEPIQTNRYNAKGDMTSFHGSQAGNPYVSSEHAGRWPANVLLDEEAAAVLDEQSGESKSPPVGSTCVSGTGQMPLKASRAVRPNGHGDSGGASRFFYIAKADREERNRGLLERNTHPTLKPVELMQWLVRLVAPPGGTILDPFAGSGSTLIAACREGFDCIGIEREAEYVAIARDRIIGDGPLLNVEVPTDG